MMGMMGCGGGMLFSLLLWVAVGASVVYLVVRLTRDDGGRDDKPDRAQQLARERFARGEISGEELDDLERRLRP